MILIFVLGLIVGSFINAALYRAHAGGSLISGRSICPHCHHQLAPRDLVPVLSFIWLRGRCRYCHRPISWQYPLVEIVTALVFILLVANLESGIWNLELAFQIIFASVFIFVAVFDFKHFLILDKVIFPTAALALVYRLALGWSIMDGVWGALLLCGFFGLQYWISSGRWIGLGDVKLGIFLGLLFGFKLSVALLMVAYILGALVGIALLLAKTRKLGSHLPLGSFLSASGIIIMLYGEALANAYLELIGYR